MSVKVRQGETELVEEAAPKGAGLRVIINQRSAVTYTNDTTDSGLDALIADAIELANLSQPDEFAGPPEPSRLANTFPELDLCDEEARSSRRKRR